IVDDRLHRLQVWSCETWKEYSWDIECDYVPFSTHHDCVFDDKSAALLCAGRSVLYKYSLAPAAVPKLAEVKIRKEGRIVSRSLGSPRPGKSLYLITLDGSKTLHCDSTPIETLAPLVPLFSVTTNYVTTMAFSGDGKECAIASDEGERGSENVIDVWSLFASKRRYRLIGARGSTYCLAFNRDGSLLVSGGADGALRFWDTESRKLTDTIQGEHSVSSIDFHPDRKVLAYSTLDRDKTQNVRIVDLRKKQVLGSVSGDVGGVHLVRFRPDGKQLASVGNDGIVRVWVVSDLIP